MSYKQEWNNVRQLIQTLDQHGWQITDVNDGDEWTGTGEGAFDLISDLDIVWVAFTKGEVTHTVMLVFGNSPAEVVADYGFTEGDADGFAALIESITASWE